MRNTKSNSCSGTIQISSNNWLIPPEEKKIILFPSYLEHSIVEHKEETTRYSLAFNIFPVGKYGVGDSTHNTDWI